MTEYPKVSKRFSSRIKKSRLGAKIKMFLITAAIVFLVISFFWGEFGFFRMWFLSRKIERLQKELTVLKVQRLDLLWETDKLRNDAVYIQRYAVETYGYARPNQRVIQLVHADSSSSARVKQAVDLKPRPRR